MISDMEVKIRSCKERKAARISKWLHDSECVSLFSARASYRKLVTNELMEHLQPQQGHYTTFHMTNTIKFHTKTTATETAKKEHRDLLDRNSRRGIAMLAVAEMWVSLTMRTGSALMMMSGISTLQTDSATTHWLAQR